jgi:hypothetical protein
MALPDLMDLIRHDPRRSMVIRAVAGTPGSSMPDVETLWRKAVFTAESAGVPLSGKFSLEDLLERKKGIALVDDGSGGQPVDVIFTSLVILTTEALAGSAAFAKFLTDRIMQRFGDLMQEGNSVTIQFGVTAATEHPVTVYMGYGVHVPAASDSGQQGRIDVLAADGEAVGEPLTSEAPAGLFPRQEMLAFSRSQNLTAAVHPDLPAGVMFCLGHVPGSAASKGSASALPPLIALPCSTDPDATSVEVRPVPLPSGTKADIRYEVTGVKAQRGRVRLCQIDVTLDSRPSRLHAQPPAGGLVLALSGFAIRESFGGRRMARYWTDRTIGGTFRHSRMLIERDCIVVQGKEPRLYRRADLRYDRGAAQGFSVDRLSFEGDRRSVLISREAPLGYLALPDQMSSVFAGSGFTGDDSFAINWVGSGITVQLASGETRPLSSFYDVSPLGMIGVGAGALRVQAGGDIWNLTSGKPVPAGTGDVMPGQRLVIGPLVVDVMEVR